MNSAFTRSIASWTQAQNGSAITEFALLFPLLLTLMMGTYDLGRGMAINQKVISASEIMADLITRNQGLKQEDLQDIILAGEIALDPFDRTPLGHDIVGIEYNDKDSPEEIWRMTDNMSENDDVFDLAQGLGKEGEGVVAVTVSYSYTPYFTAFLTDTINMQETAILRGRRSAVVDCEDC